MLSTLRLQAEPGGESRHRGGTNNRRIHSEQEATMSEVPDLRRQRTILLTTYRRDGSPVGTPVNVAVNQGHVYIRTWASSGKAKRLAANPKVTVAPSNGRGTQTGPTVIASARRLEGDEAQEAGKLIDRKYPFLQGVLVHLAHRVRKLDTVHYELSFEPS
jgi:PPOX class probable F420-dependent enzyme